MKIRGNRVGLTEIEAALVGLDTVKDSVVVAQPDERGNQCLTAFVVPSGSPPNVTSLRNSLSKLLPSYMVPARLGILDSLPRLPGGKVDRQALPSPNGARPELQNQYLRPRNVMEQELCNIWERVLGLDQVGVDNDVLELGGDSLLAATLIAAIGEVFENKLSLAALIGASTAAKMADVLRNEKMTVRDSPLVPIQPKGAKPPFFCAHGI